MRNFIANLIDLARAATDEVIHHLTVGAFVPEPADAGRLCVIAGRRPHPATDGLVCRYHLERLGALLHQVEDEAAHTTFNPDRPNDWTALPSTAARWNYATGGNTGGGDPAFQQAPAHLDPIMLSDRRTSTWGARLVGPYCADCRHLSCVVRRGADEDRDAGSSGAVNVYDTLHNYADRVRTERRLARPIRVEVTRLRNGRHGPVCGLPCTHPSCARIARWRVIRVAESITSERKVLTRHLETWIVHQDWVANLDKDLRDVLAQLQTANRTRRERPLPGRCPNLIEGRECGGHLWPSKPKHTVGEWTGSSPSAVQCGSCKTKWEGPGPLARLALITDQQRKARKGTPA